MRSRAGVAAGSIRAARNLPPARLDGMTSRYLRVLAIWVAVLAALYALQEYFS
jgi:hypothetical protein